MPKTPLAVGQVVTVGTKSRQRLTIVKKQGNDFVGKDERGRSVGLNKHTPYTVIKDVERNTEALEGPKTRAKKAAKTPAKKTPAKKTAKKKTAKKKTAKKKAR